VKRVRLLPIGLKQIRPALLFLVPIAMSAQTATLTLYTVSGGLETPVGTLYNFGTVAAGAAQDVQFRARNMGTSAVVVTTLAVMGEGFTIVNPPSLPYTIAPGNVLPFNFTVQFAAGPPATYSSNLQLNGISVLLAATSVPAPTLTVSAPCTGPDPTGLVSFVRTQQETTSACTFSIKNSYQQSLTVSPFTLSPGAFQASSPVGTTVTVSSGQAVTFPVTFAPPGSGPYSATLTIGTQTFTLSGTSYASPLPTPILTFDSTTILSGEQHTLTMHLSAPAPVQAAGFLTLAFTPANAAVSDDASVLFVATGTRVVPFTVNQGSTSVQLNSQPNVVFQTGTTAGTLTFTANPGAFGIGGSYPPVTLTVAPALVAVENAAATSRANDLDITITGYDNTYTAGGMSFTFYNTTGQVLGPSVIPADFTQAFAAYYKTQSPTGSSFLMRVTFPVTGDVTQVGSVKVTLTNAAGSVQLPSLNFP